jgi:hypothetical protein
MEDPIHLQEPVWTELARFDWYTNRLKAEYLEACHTRTLNPSTIQELTEYYGKPVTLLGGMNEAFRIFLFQRDIEHVRPSTRSGAPFEYTFLPRAGQGGLFLDYDPRQGEAVREINTACARLTELTRNAASPVEKVAIMAEYLAIKVTAHDLFVHGRGNFPAMELLNAKGVTDYVHEAAEAEPNAFRTKHALALALGKGVDPAQCVVGCCRCQERGLTELCQGMRMLLDGIDQVRLEDFFRWDVYGICAFIEGPICLRQDSHSRVAYQLEQAWSAYNWHAPVTATEAATFITHSVFRLGL